MVAMDGTLGLSKLFGTVIQVGPKTFFKYNDGGRERAGYKGETRDCVCRSISIATGMDYEKIYQDLAALGETERLGKRRKNRSHPRTGVHKKTYRKYLESLGWAWTPTMKIGSGCQVHLRKEELPSGTIIICVSRHVTAMIDGVIHDTDLDDRNGTRCVYGYFSKR